MELPPLLLEEKKNPSRGVLIGLRNGQEIVAAKIGESKGDWLTVTTGNPRPNTDREFRASKTLNTDQILPPLRQGLDQGPNTDQDWGETLNTDQEFPGGQTPNTDQEFPGGETLNIRSAEIAWVGQMKSAEEERIAWLVQMKRAEEERIAGTLTCSCSGRPAPADLL